MRMWIVPDVTPSKRLGARIFVRMESVSDFGDSVRVLYDNDEGRWEVQGEAFSR